MNLDIEVFLTDSLRTAGTAKKKLYKYSMKAWDEYCSTERLLPQKAEEKDIDGFVEWGIRERNWDIGVAITYLIPLSVFFGKRNKPLRRYILGKQKALRNQKKDTETEKPDDTQPLVFDIALKLLEAAEELRDRLCLWLLIVEGMSNLCLQKIQVRHIDFRQMTYCVDFNSRPSEKGRLRSSTVKLIEICKEKYHLEQDDGLLGIRERTIQNLAKKYARQIHLPQWKSITLNMLRKLGNSNDLRVLLVRAYEKKKLWHSFP